MRLRDDLPSIDLTTVPLHLGLGARAFAVDGFGWDPEVLAAYDEAVTADGAEGRLVMLFDGDADWTSWERHPAGDEVVLCVHGSATLLREVGASVERIDLKAGHATVNPAGAWHTLDVHEPTRLLTITPGKGTEHRPR